jgi:hypothetical protein
LNKEIRETKRLHNKVLDMDALHRNEQTYEIEGEADLENSKIEGVETFDSNDTKFNTSKNGVQGRRSMLRRRVMSSRSIISRSMSSHRNFNNVS